MFHVKGKPKKSKQILLTSIKYIYENLVPVVIYHLLLCLLVINIL